MERNIYSKAICSIIETHLQKQEFRARGGHNTIKSYGIYRIIRIGFDLYRAWNERGFRKPYLDLKGMTFESHCCYVPEGAMTKKTNLTHLSGIEI